MSAYTQGPCVQTDTRATLSLERASLMALIWAIGNGPFPPLAQARKPAHGAGGAQVGKRPPHKGLCGARAMQTQLSFTHSTCV